jgi:PAS domain S-box-containing protein
LILDSKGKVQSFNHAAEMIFGWSADEIIGKSVINLFVNHLGKTVNLTSLMESLRAENCYDLNDMEQNALESVLGVRKNKTTFYVDVTVSTITRRNGTQDTILTVRDVTPYVNIQKELSESELHYKTIFDMSFDGICILNDFKIVEVNASWCAIFHTKKEDAIGMDFRKFVDEEHIGKFSVCHQRHIDGEDMIFEFELLVCNGSRVVVTCAPVATSANTFASIVTIRDVTCRRCCNPSY